jgi:hypothetical protein
MADARGKRRPTVIFVDDWGWTSFDQAAAGLRRRRWRTIRLTSARPGKGELPPLRVADRLFYDRCWALDKPADQARVVELLDSGCVADVFVAEQALDNIGLETPVARALARRSLAFTGTPAEQALDKFWVNAALAAAGIGTPQQIWAAELSPEEAARRFGLPLVIKQPIGAAGYQVRIAKSVAEIRSHLAELGGPEAPLFYQEHVPGRELLYCAVVGPQGTLVQHAFVVSRHTFNRGPASLAALYDSPAVLAAGAQAVEVLRPLGLLQLCFIEAADGRLFHIDANLRPWGMMAAPLQLGIDYLGVYAALAGGAAAAHGMEAAPGMHWRFADAQALRVQPCELFSAARSVALRQTLASAALLLHVYLRPFGPVYCGYLLSRAVLLMGRGVQRKLTAQMSGAIRALSGAPAGGPPLPADGLTLDEKRQ